MLLRWRWFVAGIITLAFALGQLLESLLLPDYQGVPRLILDVVGWGLLGGLAVWISLTWASRQERRYQAELETSLAAQQALNGQLRRANDHLALLGKINRQIASAATLDEILDRTLSFPRQLVDAQASALLLLDAGHPLVTRSEGVPVEQIGQWRQAFGVPAAVTQPTIRQLTQPIDPKGETGACLLLPLQDREILVGWIELYLRRALPLPDDERVLLETIGFQVAQAILSARRRTAEERAIYALESAIMEERARIARDIHDGLAQTMAFRRMRVDLWLDWLESEPDRLRGELVALKDALREQIADLRRAIFALRPIQFDRLGFVGGLHRYIEEFGEQQGWIVEIDLSHIPPALSSTVEAIAFRVIQEALTNVAKHARADTVSISMQSVDGGIQIWVRDNGIGFEPGRQIDAVAGRLGLRQMRERLASVRGQLTILAQPGAGTEIRAWLPLHPTESEDAHGTGTTAAG
jgi:signal transduction histidine kinase